MNGVDLLSLPAYLFGRGARLRGRLYDLGWLETVRLSSPVISVGNLTVGGTGKTPFSIWIMERLRGLGIKPGYVSRGFGSRSKGVREVVRPDPCEFGDEAALIRDRFSNLPMFIGAKRPEAAAALARKYPIDVIIADDAFQHRRLWRDLDIVLLDALEPQTNYRFLPIGRAREGFESLNRADVAVITKANLATTESLAYLETQIQTAGLLVLRMNYLSGGFFKNEKRYSELPGPAFLISGVGRPASVEPLVNQVIVKHKIYADHFSYQASDADQIFQEFKESGAHCLVTTSKDAVKLKQFSRIRDLLFEMRLETKMEGDLDEFDRQIRRLVRPNN